MVDRDYAADAKKLAKDHLADLRDIDTMSIVEVLDADLDADDIEAIREEISAVADKLEAALEGNDG